MVVMSRARNTEANPPCPRRLTQAKERAELAGLSEG